MPPTCHYFSIYTELSTDIVDMYRSPQQKSGGKYVILHACDSLSMLTSILEISKVHRREENLDERKEVDGRKLREDKFLGVSVVIPV